MPVDYATTEDGDLLFDGNDLVISESTYVHQQDILLAAKGDYRQYPDVGVDLRSWIDDDAAGDLPAAIRKEFEKDGMRVDRVKVFENGSADILGFYD